MACIGKRYIDENIPVLQVQVASPLKIISAKAVQAVPDVNLVKGKNTAIQATVTAEGADPSDSTPIIITATMPDGATIDRSSQTRVITIGQAAAAGPSGLVVTALKWTPNSTAPGQTISVVAQAGNDTRSDPFSFPIVVQKTNPLGVVYFSMSTAFGSVPASGFQQDIAQSVTINRDGTVTYKPLGRGRADRFTVTIQDNAGDTATVTVQVTAARDRCEEER